MKTKQFHITKVYTRNVITDFVQSIRNFLGLELTSYANTIQKGITECMKQTPKNKKWYKIDVEQISNGAFMIVVYGESK